MSDVQLSIRYDITLPADYDMGIIRERVRTRGHALDDRAGLALKAYCVRERGRDGASSNAYAPFYLWADATAAADFLWGGAGFQGIVGDFGRPTVDTWIPASLAAGSAVGHDVTHAALRIAHLAPDADLVATAAELHDRCAGSAQRPEVHRAFAGIDPTTWTSVEFCTVAGLPEPIEGATTLSVLHVSEPGGR